MTQFASLSPGLQQQMQSGLKQLHERRWADAEAIYRRILPDQMGNADVHFNLAIALQGQGKVTDAIGELRTALMLNPNSPQAWITLGSALRQDNRPAEAVEAHRRALALQPDFHVAWINLGNALSAMHKTDEAIDAYRRAVTLRPDFAEAWCNLGNSLRDQRQFAEAVDAYRRAVTLRPKLAEMWNNLGYALRDMDRLPEAIDAYRHALWARATFGVAWHNLAGALKDTGQLDEALTCFDRVIALEPDDPKGYSFRLCNLHYHPGYDAAAIHREAKQWNDRFVHPLGGSIARHENVSDPLRRLRIAYVSADFRHHCESLFTLPLLANHDHQAYEIFCYSNSEIRDAITSKLQRHADHWREIPGLSDEEAAAAIRQDGIDIFVDLALHTSGNRMGVFARKPAPIQVTWLGYPGTTGLETIDYRMTDPWLDPLDPQVPPATDPGQIGVQHPYYAERSVYLAQGYWCYEPRGMEDQDDVPLLQPGPLPALKNGHVTFGSLNNFCKVNNPLLALWSQVMAAVPDSHILLMTPSGPQRDWVVRKLGVAPERVEFVARQSRREYLETYHRIDLCLDTLPFNGGTTSLDALWMGIPVLTRIGSTVVGRAGSSHLNRLGLGDLVAQTDEQFVKLAVAWASDLDRLGECRGTLRQRMEQSSLMNGSAFARQMEDAYRQMWRTWCREKS